jgi:hypothetical protein
MSPKEAFGSARQAVLRGILNVMRVVVLGHDDIGARAAERDRRTQ